MGERLELYEFYEQEGVDSNVVEFDIGQIINHRIRKYRGVIIGYDETCKAPDGWKQTWVKPPLITKGPDQPFYHVLVDVRHQRTWRCYVAQENITALDTDEKAAQIIN